jgi:AcrR family transcriptional regulator
MAQAGATTERVRAAHLGPDRRRPQVLDTALELVLERGVDAVTMGAIAQRLGVTRPVVYACYGGRSEVLTALLEREQRRLLRSVLAALPADPLSGEPQRLLIEAFRALLRAVAAEPDPWRALFAAGDNPAIASSFAASRATVARTVAPLLGSVLDRRGTPGLARKLPVLADFSVAVGERAIRTVLDESGDFSADRLAELTGDFLFHALKNA